MALSTSKVSLLPVSNMVLPPVQTLISQSPKPLDIEFTGLSSD